ncbi:MAG: phosphoesterase, partial [Saprospirales bacterium]
MYDIIGDIHGHSEELLLLLGKLGYCYQGGAYRHPDRIALFLGDYIDRGPDSLRCLEIVKAMVDEGSAVALMGNHEYNAICFHQQDKTGGHLRPHLIKNVLQHETTLKSFKRNQELYEAYINWFRSLPMYFENDQFRAVHACWEPKSLAVINERLSDGALTEALAVESADKKTELYDA